MTEAQVVTLIKDTSDPKKNARFRPATPEEIALNNGETFTFARVVDKFTPRSVHPRWKYYSSKIGMPYGSELSLMINVSTYGVWKSIDLNELTWIELR